MRSDGAKVRQLQYVLQAVAIAQRLAEELARVEEDDRHRRVDLRQHVQNDHRPDPNDETAAMSPANSFAVIASSSAGPERPA